MMSIHCPECYQRAELCNCPASVQRARPLVGELIEFPVRLPAKPRDPEPPKDDAA